ncbi:MAG: alanine:cation symporter family protein [Endomicrobium sp.]|jgi:AGCS family alanine or glycine:cation symporter|nr:alanine:cation symporter family protein [Endomicrobium sp.]
MESFPAVIIGQLNSFTLAFPVFIIILTYLYFTLKTNFIQKKLFKGLKLALTRQGQYDQGELLPFYVFCTEFGVGNAIGVTTAIAIGGVGSAFWVLVVSLAVVAVK